MWLFGDSHGVGNSVEHNIAGRRRILCVLSYLSLAAACSTAGVTDLLLDADGSYCPPKLCSRYQLSAAMAFLSWE
ncbi:hypothetical protein Ahy_A01g004824 [Arachis hypogaea]|uniref:CASP-like protein n=1 Tax=Arachis hypogaea TaxID=3818 RepID=A0A445EXB0_ARAHY|nr:hypothetical protein Ahy_A01g004824 [Arachis hypogaea]